MNFKRKTEIRNSEFLEHSFPFGDAAHFYLYRGELLVDCPHHGLTCPPGCLLDDAEYVVGPGRPDDFVLEVFNCSATSVFTQISRQEAKGISFLAEILS